MLHAFVPRAADERSGRQRRRRFQREARPECCTATAAEQRRQRRRHGNRGERLDRGSLRALPPRKGRALLALAEVRPQRGLVLSAQAAVELFRDGELGFPAGERRLELFAEGTARAEDQRLHCARRELQGLSDLCV